MKKIFKYTLAAAASTCLLSACNLDLVPNSAIAYSPAETLIQTQANLNALENGMLASFRSLSLGEFDVTEEVMLDGFNAVVDYGNNYGSEHRTDNSFTSANYEVEDYWAGNYGAIKNYNIFIANADESNADIRAKARVVKGEAFFFRAYSYLQLARHFGKAYDAASAASELCVPLVLVYEQNEKPARATVAEVYASIKSDLDSAAVLLAGVKGAVRSQKPTIDAVNALYARYYIDVKDYAKAATYAHKVIDAGTYKLASSAKEMEAEYTDDKGTEPIMQMYCTLAEYGNSTTTWTNTSSEKSVPEGYVLAPYFLPTKTLIESYEASDVRLAWFSNTLSTRISGSIRAGEFYSFVKFIGNPALTSTPVPNGRTSPKPLKIAEMYLIAAEANLAAGNTTAALVDLNALQAARGASQTVATKENIQKEWFKETVGEGLRLSCLKRWGVGFSGRVCQDGASNVVLHGGDYDQKVWAANDFHFQWPIPSHEMKINKNLVQNTGYDTL